MSSIEKIINKLNLKPHPEGGYFTETYRSVGEIKKESLDISYDGNRNFSTCIYFLLTSNKFSAFHKIKQDEIWHFYDGSPIKIYVISKEGRLSCQIIGRDFSKGEVPQFIVSGGSWFAAEVLNENDYSLVGCTVSPGFDFNDFELKSREELISLFPRLEEVITKLTHF